MAASVEKTTAASSSKPSCRRTSAALPVPTTARGCHAFRTLQALEGPRALGPLGLVCVENSGRTHRFVVDRRCSPRSCGERGQSRIRTNGGHSTSTESLALATNAEGRSPSATTGSLDEFAAILTEIDRLRSSLTATETQDHQDHEAHLSGVRRRAALLFVRRIVPLFAATLDVPPVEVLRQTLPAVVSSQVRINVHANRIEVNLGPAARPGAESSDARFTNDAIRAFVRANYPLGIAIAKEVPPSIVIQPSPEPR